MSGGREEAERRRLAKETLERSADGTGPLRLWCWLFGHKLIELHVAGHFGGLYCPRCNSAALLPPPSETTPSTSVGRAPAAGAR